MSSSVFLCAVARLTARPISRAIRYWGLSFAWLAYIASFAAAQDRPFPTYVLHPSEGDIKILHALGEATMLDFVEQPLSDVVQYLEDLHAVQIELDNLALEDAGVSSDTPVTRNLQKIPLASALELLLDELRLDYLVTKDVLLITSKERAEQLTELKVYNVKELLNDERTACSIAEMVTKMFGESDGHHLMVADVGETLVIRDTQRGHRDIEALLVVLRRALAGEPQPAAAALPLPASQREGGKHAQALAPAATAAAAEQAADAAKNPFEE